MKTFQQAVEKFHEAHPGWQADRLASRWARVNGKPDVNWHLFSGAETYLATVKWDGRITYDGPKPKRGKRSWVSAVRRAACCLLAVGIASASVAQDASFTKRIEKVSPAQLAQLETGLQHGATLAGPMACVKSRLHNNAYLVGAVLAIPVPSGKQYAGAVWLVGGSREEPHLTFSVDGFAQKFSDWGALESTKYWAGDDQDAADLRKYVETRWRRIAEYEERRRQARNEKTQRQLNVMRRAQMWDAGRQAGDYVTPYGTGRLLLGVPPSN